MLGQMMEIQSCTQRYRSAARRLAYFDTDEFLVLGERFLGDLHAPPARPSSNSTSNTSTLLTLQASGGPCRVFQMVYAHAQNDGPLAVNSTSFDEAYDGEGCLRLGWLAKSARLLTGPPDAARSKTIVTSSIAVAMGAHRAFDPYMPCYVALRRWQTAFFSTSPMSSAPTSLSTAGQSSG